MVTDSMPHDTWPSPRLGYHPPYKLGGFALEGSHPSHSRKYGRAWAAVRRTFGRQLGGFHVKPPRPINHSELLTVHTEAYLRRLREPKFVAGVLEMAPL